MKTALILGNIDRGTIHTSLETNNIRTRTKHLNTSVKNWISICKLLEEDTQNEIIVLGKFTEHILFKMCLPEYREVVERFLTLMKMKKHVVFIYKDNLIGRFSFSEGFPINTSPYFDQFIEDGTINPLMDFELRNQQFENDFDIDDLLSELKNEKK